MAWCATCGRGSWACVCGVPFAEKMRSWQSRPVKNAPRHEFDAPRQPPAPDPLERLKGDDRYSALATLRDRMISSNAPERPFTVGPVEKPMGF